MTRLLDFSITGSVYERYSYKPYFSYNDLSIDGSYKIKTIETVPAIWAIEPVPFCFLKEYVDEEGLISILLRQYRSNNSPINIRLNAFNKLPDDIVMEWCCGIRTEEEHQKVMIAAIINEREHDENIYGKFQYTQFIEETSFIIQKIIDDTVSFTPKSSVVNSIEQRLSRELTKRGEQGMFRKMKVSIDEELDTITYTPTIMIRIKVLTPWDETLDFYRRHNIKYAYHR